MTTVGYGDMSGKTHLEQFYCCGLMIAGVFIFSVISGSLASILTSMDNENADLKEKVTFLNRLQ